VQRIAEGSPVEWIIFVTTLTLGYHVLLIAGSRTRLTTLQTTFKLVRNGPEQGIFRGKHAGLKCLKRLKPGTWYSAT